MLLLLAEPCPPGKSDSLGKGSLLGRLKPENDNDII
jgi:hypothetical protein